jgi:hypothetical protein
MNTLISRNFRASWLNVLVEPYVADLMFSEALNGSRFVLAFCSR